MNSTPLPFGRSTLIPALVRLVSTAPLLIALSARAAQKSAPVSLFNGKDLSGWEVYLGGQEGPVTDQDIFQVADGVIHVYAEAEDQSEQPFGMLTTAEEYDSYRISLEYRWGEKKFAPRADASVPKDAGLLFHVQEPIEVWPACVECQIEFGDTGDIWVIKTQVTSTVHPANRNFTEPENGGVEMTRGDSPTAYNRFFRSASYEKEGWNHVEVVVEGDTATYIINGQVANRAMRMKKWDAASETWVPLTRGRIVLQAEGAELYYRDINLTPLD